MPSKMRSPGKRVKEKVECPLFPGLNAYDAADRLTTLAHKTAGGTAVASYAYTYDNADRLTGEVRTWASGGNGDTLAYSYTDNGQLTGVTHTNGAFAAESFGYDANGNRNTGSYATGTGNRLAGDGSYTYTYDDQGNLAEKTLLATGARTLYSWDHRNRLTAVDSVVSGVTTTLATYTYDALDRRIGVREGGATTWTLYDGVAALLDFDGAGTQTVRYLQGPVVDEVLARETSGGTVAWYLSDRLGSVRDVANNSGTVVDHVDYTAFGDVLGETNPSAGDRWKYAGREYDAAIGQYYNRARWYDPKAGRFTGVDPIGFTAGDTNLYRYVFNFPTSARDPSGHGIGDDTGSRLSKDEQESLGGWLWRHIGPGTFPVGTVTGGPLIAIGQPIVPKPRASIGGRHGMEISSKTSPASSFLTKAFPQKLPGRWLAPTNMGLRRTATLGTFLGRWTPFVGHALTAADASSLLLYISKDYTPEQWDAVCKAIP